MSAKVGTLLVEARTEELPPQLLRDLADQFPDGLLANLRKAGFADDDSRRATASSPKGGNDPGRPKLLATPRRIAAQLTNIRRKADDRTTTRRGPQVAAGLDSGGAPTKALAGFMRATGTQLSDLRKVTERGKEYFAADIRDPGGDLDGKLAAITESTLLSLNAPRLMRWGANDWRFIRPLRGLVMLWESEVIPGEVMGIKSSPETLGHRFLSDGPVTIPSAKEYESVLETASVVADLKTRRESISEQMNKLMREGEFIDPPEMPAGEFEGENPPPPTIKRNNPLLAEVVAICEWPVAHRMPIPYGENFPAPIAAVKACIGEQQKGFLIRGDSAVPSDCLVVADSNPADPETMLRGFNAVMRARLRDIRFYYETDRNLSLDDCREKLKGIAYHSKLGSQHDRVERVRKIAARIAERVSLPENERAEVDKAIQISKAALPTLMVGEYPALAADMAVKYFCQGDLKNLGDIVRIHEKAAGGRKGICVCASFHLEKLVGMFGVGEFPTGSKDPHGLRMSAVGVVNSLYNLRGSKTVSAGLFLDDLVSDAVEVFGEEFRKAEDTVFQFIVDRAKQMSPFAKSRQWGFTDAVLSRRPLNFVLAAAKADALERVGSVIAELGEHRRRIDNIFRKSEVDIGKMPPVDKSLFQQEEERSLCEAIRIRREETEKHVALAEREQLPPDELPLFGRSKRYRAALESTAGVTLLVRNFFEQVLVNADDERIRVNRFALLAELRALLDRVVDIAKLRD